MSREPFRKRRQELMKQMGAGSIALFCSPPEYIRNGDSHYPFRQNSDLLYLSDFDEPESALVLRPGEKEESVLYVRPKDPERETWEGRRAGPKGAIDDYGVDAAYPIAQLYADLPKMLAHTDSLYFSLGLHPSIDSQVSRTVHQMRMSERRVGPPPRRIIDPRLPLHEMRLHKGAEELDLMRRAAAITCEAHSACMAAANTDTSEYALQALLEYTFRKHGASGPGYPCIVGSGDNATILHYTENQSPLGAGELVLIDAGAEYRGYTADVTRTFPVDGTFTPPQQAAYEVVLASQEQAIDMTKPGICIDDIHDKCVEVLSQGMLDLGLLKGSLAEVIEKKLYRKYYMHRTSHWLGMDVHDVGTYYDQPDKARTLGDGMVLTIEPGLYIPQADETAPPEFRGIGIRIEDDILVTKSGFENLSAACPKTVADIQTACRA